MAPCSDFWRCRTGIHEKVTRTVQWKRLLRACEAGEDKVGVGTAQIFARADRDARARPRAGQARHLVV
eukprot:3733462-Pleurochrysis_carterae.AAC.1